MSTKNNEGLTRFNFYIEPSLLEELKQRASADRRSVSSTINIAIERYLKTKEDIDA